MSSIVNFLFIKYKWSLYCILKLYNRLQIFKQSFRRIVSCTTVLIRNVSIIKQNVDLYLTIHMLFRILSYLELPVPRFFKTDPPIS